MKTAVIADIHGNLPALDAVLTDMAHRDVQLVVNLGDSLSGFLFPRETADRLMTLDMPTIRGNHERQLLASEQDRMGPADAFTASALTPEHRAWMAALPETRRVLDDVLLVHGTPRSDMEYFLHTVTPDGLHEATDDEILERARSADEVDATSAAVILCGHTHLPRVFRLDDGRLVVNPGSVGLQAYEYDHPYPHRVENGSPHARYAILEQRDGRWSAELVTVSYDWERSVAAATANGRPDWAGVLRTGQLPANRLRS